MKREEFIGKYIEEYLEGRDEVYRNSFLAKPVDRQYGTLQTWKRRKLNKAAKDCVNIEDIIDNLKCVGLQISNLPELSEKDENRLFKTLDNIKEAISGFKEVMRKRKLKELQELRSRLDKEISELQKSPAEKDKFDNIPEC